MSGPAKDFVRGSISNRPFRPGGLDDSQSLERTLPDGASSGEWVHQLLIGGPAQAIPPSFKQGLDLGYLQVNLIATLIESCKIKIIAIIILTQSSFGRHIHARGMYIRITVQSRAHQMKSWSVFLFFVFCFCFFK